MALPEEILAFLTNRPPEEQIARRADLDVLGEPEAVDAALQELAADMRIGTPADGYWMPLDRWVDAHGHVHYAAPALLTDLLKTVVEREGLIAGPSRGELNYERYMQSGGREGGWGVPTYANVGVSRPFPLIFRWHTSLAATEYREQTTPMPSPSHSTPFEILNRNAFRADCIRAGVVPARLEKDLYVNRLLRAVGTWNEVHGESMGTQLCLHGGTCLVKGWQSVDRFSEDVDCMVLWRDAHQNHADTQTAWAEVRAHIQAFITDYLADHVPGARLWRERGFKGDNPLQTMRWAYQAQCGSPMAADGRRPQVQARLKMDVMMSSPYNLSEQVFVGPAGNFPSPLGHTKVRVATLPLVFPWMILAGKFQAIAKDMKRWVGDGSYNRFHIRHFIDIFLSRMGILGGLEGAPKVIAHLAMATKSEQQDIWDMLAIPCDALTQAPIFKQAYHAYVDEMFYGRDRLNMANGFPFVVDGYIQVYEVLRQHREQDTDNNGGDGGL